VNLRLGKGFVYTFKGGNGSVKSMVLKTIYGLLKPWGSNRKEGLTAKGARVSQGTQGGNDNLNSDLVVYV